MVVQATWGVQWNGQAGAHSIGRRTGGHRLERAARRRGRTRLGTGADDRAPLRSWATSCWPPGLVAVGVAITHLDLFGGLRHWDDDISRWFVPRRTNTGAHVTSFWTEVANTEGIVAVAIVVEVVLAVHRRWRDLLLVLVGLAVELAVFLTVNEVVRRPRPSVPKLGIEPATFSFPSGHIAATVVLYGSIAVLVTLSLPARPVDKPRVARAGRVRLVVGYARVYRGMHHVSDVVAGALLGVMSLLVAVIATRAASMALSAPERPGPSHSASSRRRARPSRRRSRVGSVTS